MEFIVTSPSPGVFLTCVWKLEILQETRTAMVREHEKQHADGGGAVRWQTYVTQIYSITGILH